MTPHKILVALHRLGAGASLSEALSARGFTVETSRNRAETWARAQPGSVAAVVLVPASADPAAPEIGSLLRLRQFDEGPALLLVGPDRAHFEALVQLVDGIVPEDPDPDYLALWVRMAMRRRRLEDEARRDDLTGLFNDRAFSRQVTVECSRAIRDGQPLGFLKLDIDRFKVFNDKYGYDVGNAVLKKLAAALHRNLRAYDFPARLGGGADEFVVLLPETGLRDAAATAQRIRLAVQASSVKHDGQRSRFTISVGAASCQPAPRQRLEDFLADFERHMKGAERAMQRAKQRRNRVESFEAAPAAPPTQK